MKKLAALVFLLAMAGAGWWFYQRDAAVEYTVVRGDTLFLIAKAHGVTVDDLRAWNGIEGDLIEVDQILRIYPPGDAPAATSSGGGRASSGRRAAPPATVERPQDLDDGWKPLSMPAPEPCIPFDPELGDQDIVAAAGLDYGQLRAGLGTVLNETLRCDPDPGASEVSLRFELTVGCDGVVDDVRATSAGGASDAFTNCVAGVLQYADFPAHDMEGGMTFEYPVEFEF